MTIKITQKVIRIGTSRGVTIPAKDLRALGADTGDELEIIVRKSGNTADDRSVRSIADDILERYDQDFRNLSER